MALPKPTTVGPVPVSTSTSPRRTSLIVARSPPASVISAPATAAKPGSALATALPLLRGVREAGTGAGGIVSFRNGFGSLGSTAGRAGAGRWSSSTNGDGPAASARTTAWTLARVMPTWKIRRSSSTSADRRWGNSPASAPKTTTRDHSRPLTRWTVARCTPGSAEPPSPGPAAPAERPPPAVSACCSQRSKVAASGWSGATWRRAARSSPLLERSRAPLLASSVSIASPRPMVSPMKRSRSAVVAPGCAKALARASRSLA